MSNYIVTGSAGFIGSRVSEMLLAAGHRVTGVDDLSDGYAPQLKGVEAGPARIAPAIQLLQSRYPGQGFPCERVRIGPFRWPPQFGSQGGRAPVGEEPLGIRRGQSPGAGEPPGAVQRARDRETRSGVHLKRVRERHRPTLQGIGPRIDAPCRRMPPRRRPPRPSAMPTPLPAIAEGVFGFPVRRWW